MKKSNKITLITISILLNIILIIFIGIGIYNNGKGFIKVAIKPNKNIATDEHSIKLDIYKNLKINNGDIVFIGDSLSNYYNFSEKFENLNIKNRAIAGDTISQAIDVFQKCVSSENPKKIFIMVGINDFNKEHDIKAMKKDYEELIELIKGSTSDTEIFIESILPINKDIKQCNYSNDDIIAFNKYLKQLSKKHSIKFIDLYNKFIDDKGNLNYKYTDDGIHINSEGYDIWIDALEEYVN